MKKADIATIILVASLATIIAYFVGNLLLGDPSTDTKSIMVMDPIKSEISDPDGEIFNVDAVNPTVEVYVGKCPDGSTWSDMDQECLVSQPIIAPSDDSAAGSTDNGANTNTGNDSVVGQ